MSCSAHSHVLLQKDFRIQPFIPDEFPISFGNDGAVTQDASGLTITSVPFTATVPIGNEHPKWLHYYKNTFAVPRCGELVYEGYISMKQFIPIEKIPTDFIGRIRNVHQDIRLASAGINMYDPSTWMVADWFVSDQGLWAFYERLPFGKNVPPLGNYEAFSFAKLVGSRTADPASDFVRLGLGVSRETGTLRWYINGEKVFEVDRIGLPLTDDLHLLEHGGEAGLVEIKQVNVGFGTFSLLDMALPNNYSRDLTEGDSIAVSQLVQLDLAETYIQLYKGFTGAERPIDPSQTFAVVLDQYPDHNHDIKLFGQGATLYVKKISVIHYH